jgi:peptide/nickel transport system permease protein
VTLLASAAALLLLGVSSVVGPWVLPRAADAVQLDAILHPPSLTHPLGTDDLGRDVLARVLTGGRYSLLIGLLAAALATGLGTVVGAAAGYAGGRTDGVLMRMTDVLYAIPTLPLLLVLTAFWGSTPVAIAALIGALSWMGTARAVRSEVLSLRERAFVESARVSGGTGMWIITRHLVPNALGPVVVGATLAVGSAIIVESSMSFLGLGVQPPTPTWGNMLMDAQASMSSAPWMMLFPGLAILVTVLSVNFLGDGLRDALDPREARR